MVISLEIESFIFKYDLNIKNCECRIIFKSSNIMEIGEKLKSWLLNLKSQFLIHNILKCDLNFGKMSVNSCSWN